MRSAASPLEYPAERSGADERLPVASPASDPGALTVSPGSSAAFFLPSLRNLTSFSISFMMVRMSLCDSCSSSTISLATLYEESVSVLKGNSTVRVCPVASPIFRRRRRVLSSRMRPLTRKSRLPPLRRSFPSSAADIDARSSLLADREDCPSLLLGRCDSAPIASIASASRFSLDPEGDAIPEPAPSPPPPSLAPPASSIPSACDPGRELPIPAPEVGDVVSEPPLSLPAREPPVGSPFSLAARELRPTAWSSAVAYPSSRPPSLPTPSTLPGAGGA